MQPHKQSNQSNKRKIALVLSIIPGFGQFYNKQIVKGITFLILTSAFIFAFGDLLRYGFWGLVTLGTDPQYDHSIFLLIEGILTVLLAVLLAGIYIFNLYDAYKTGKKRDNEEEINGLKEQYRSLVDNGFPYLIMSPGFLLMVFVVIFPILFVILLSFTNYDLYHTPPASLVDWVGFKNFVDIFKVPIWRETFFSVLSWTIVWTFVATSLQIAVGIFLAVIVNQKDLKFKKIFRNILILPWAVPAFVSILVFAGMFNETFGTINRDILGFFGIENIPWMTNAMFTRLALIFIQTWLGFPFIFVMTTGVLQSIPNELYEAAEVDGATIFQKFRHITLPLVLFVTAPILITQFTGNFNNFNAIYLFNGGGPAMPGQNAGGTDILISWIYSLTMTSAQYGKAAAITMILSVIVIAVALWQFRRTKSFQEEDMM
ncbi:carbohydrate ABC transporter permease [Robertmurraya massiliosenegalensis]|uniref:carbohydrate ABC transporter permease n=1 Tax=Robertmurraya massiliosenegalensis TaxID=1287657 RepID=UPI0002EF41FB|nr:sugar ABC transporter permease [Robertmurraya massiliosenegalensis]